MSSLEYIFSSSMAMYASRTLRLIVRSNCSFLSTVLRTTCWVMVEAPSLPPVNCTTTARRMPCRSTPPCS